MLVRKKMVNLISVAMWFKTLRQNWKAASSSPTGYSALKIQPRYKFARGAAN